MSLSCRIGALLDHVVLEELSDKDLAELQRELWFFHSRCVAISVNRENQLGPAG